MSRPIVLAGLLVVCAASAAGAQAPQVPTPANPFPYEPVATDGTPLPSQAAVGSPYGVRGPLAAGRSVGIDAPDASLGGVIGGGLSAADPTLDGVAGGPIAGGALGR